ncbi:MAG: hypothetical protein JWP14_363 [Frankiales bacterium]|nr:hypothetical protein [Frankiales bacterium]
MDHRPFGGRVGGDDLHRLVDHLVEHASDKGLLTATDETLTLAARVQGRGGAGDLRWPLMSIGLIRTACGPEESTWTLPSCPPGGRCSASPVQMNTSYSSLVVDRSRDVDLEKNSPGTVRVKWNTNPEPHDQRLPLPDWFRSAANDLSVTTKELRVHHGLSGPVAHQIAKGDNRTVAFMGMDLAESYTGLDRRTIKEMLTKDGLAVVGLVADGVSGEVVLDTKAKPYFRGEATEWSLDGEPMPGWDQDSARDEGYRLLHPSHQCWSRSQAGDHGYRLVMGIVAEVGFVDGTITLTEIQDRLGISRSAAHRTGEALCRSLLAVKVKGDSLDLRLAWAGHADLDGVDDGDRIRERKAQERREDFLELPARRDLLRRVRDHNASGAAVVDAEHAMLDHYEAVALEDWLRWEADMQADAELAEAVVLKAVIAVPANDVWVEQNEFIPPAEASRSKEVR